jgi:hypothetical protein
MLETFKHSLTETMCQTLSDFVSDQAPLSADRTFEPEKLECRECKDSNERICFFCSNYSTTISPYVLVNLVHPNPLSDFVSALS